MAHKYLKSIKIIANLLILAIICYLIYGFFKQAGNLAIFNSQEINRIAEGRSNYDDFLEKKAKLLTNNSQACFTAVGDIMPARGVNQKFAKNGCAYIFKGVLDYFKKSDFVVVNVESTLSSTTCPYAEPDTMSFCAPKSFANCLVKPDGDLASEGPEIKVLASLANNHTMNYGVSGLQDTMQALKMSDILYLGAGNNDEEANSPVIIEQNGIKFGFLAYADRNILSTGYDATSNLAGVNPMDFDLLEKGIAEAKKQVQFVIILMHSGEEYTANANLKQINFAHKAIDLGADLVIGHHPHVVQNAEIYNGKYIFYSLGNFIFDQMWSQDTKNGLMTKFCFDKTGLENIQLIPIEIKDYSQPNIILNDSGKKIIDKLKINTQNTEVLQFINNNFTTSTIFRIGNLKNNRARSYFNYYFDKDYYYNLENGKFELLDGKNSVFKSKPEWFIDDVKIARLDLTTTTPDIVMSLWKSGNYGDVMPSWEKENDPSVKNHMFVYRFSNGKLEAKWQSSNLKNPNCAIEFADINNDGLDELITIEGDYTNNFDCVGKRYAVLKWNGWGFEKMWQSGEGEYGNLRILNIDNIVSIFIDKE
jgi:poly-gamma-glutamate synthesis protein (capsule biosynthesis protein)